MTFWNVFFLLFIFIPLATLWIRTIFDIFDRRDLTGMAKALWIFAAIAIPLLGTLVYLVTRPVTEQDRERAETMQAALREAQTQQRHLAGFSVADEIGKLEQLRDAGSLTPAEFDRQRERVLA